MTKKIAIAGLGSAARRIHLPAFSKLKDVEVVGGFDPAAKDDDFDFPLFSSPEEMVETTGPDILSIAAPTDHHFDLARMGLMAGLHVFCEKPFVNSMENAVEIMSLSKKVNRWVVVNNQFRFMNIFSEAKKKIGGPGFGDLLFISAHQTFFTTAQTERGWRGEDRRRTCKDFGTHALDLCRFFFDEDPSAISARMPTGADPDSPDLLNLIQLEFSGDRVAHITLDRICRGPHRYLDMRLDGSEACVEIRIGGGVEFAMGIRGGARKPYINFDISMGGRALLYHGEKFRKIASDPLDGFASGSARLFRAFLDALDSGGTPPCNAQDNTRTLALMLAAYESSESNDRVEMNYQTGNK